MKQLTQHQKEFILQFFENPNYVGWKSIAEKLINTGKCIVAGTTNTWTDKIWIGGVGNFIDYKDTEEAVGCTLYTLDVEALLSSGWFQENKDLHYKRLKQQKEEALSKVCTIEAKISEIGAM